jgi:hypothetical protein
VVHTDAPRPENFPAGQLGQLPSEANLPEGQAGHTKVPLHDPVPVEQLKPPQHANFPVGHDSHALVKRSAGIAPPHPAQESKVPVPLFMELPMQLLYALKRPPFKFKRPPFKFTSPADIISLATFSENLFPMLVRTPAFITCTPPPALWAIFLLMMQESNLTVA